jgi:hypothetical protein
MKWIYWFKLYDSEFQASCVVKRLETDGGMFSDNQIVKPNIFKTKKRYGARYQVLL